MPNEHGQITREDFKAPRGEFRIIREEMSDGELSIIADFTTRNFAEWVMTHLREEKGEDVYTLCDENGVVNEPE